MDNTYITNMVPDWHRGEVSGKVRFVNRILKRLGFWVQLGPPDFSGNMTNLEQRMNMYHLVSQVLAYEVPGAFVELGCNEGRSAMLFRHIMNLEGGDRELHVYDSFEGLPAVAEQDGDTPFEEGQMATSQQRLLDGFKARKLEPPIVHVGWFDKTLPTQLPEEIAFAHLDGDLYDSIKVSLEYVYPRLSKGAVCLVDDYSDPEAWKGFNKFPGVKQACDEYLADKPEEVTLLFSGSFSHGYFRKL